MRMREVVIVLTTTLLLACLACTTLAQACDYTLTGDTWSDLQSEIDTRTNDTVLCVNPSSTFTVCGTGLDVLPGPSVTIVGLNNGAGFPVVMCGPGEVAFDVVDGGSSGSVELVVRNINFQSNASIPEDEGLLMFEGVDYLELDGIVAGGFDGDGHLVLVSGAADVVIRASLFHDCFTAAVVLIKATESLNVSDTTFRDNTNASLAVIRDFSTNTAVTVSSCTFEDNDNSAIWAKYSELSVTDSVFQRNTASDGGAIYCVYCGQMNVTNSSFNANSASSDGGAIAFVPGSWMSRDYGPLEVHDGVTFEENVAGHDGGAVYYKGLAGSSVTIHSDVSFTSNIAGNDGGAAMLYKDFYGDVYDGVTFTGNVAGQHGGGLCETYDLSFNITDDVHFEDNVAASNGGGLYAHQGGGGYLGGGVSFKNNTGSYGGGANIDLSDFVVTSVTFENNTASGPGGGLVTANLNSYTVTNCQFNGNSAVGDGGGGAYSALGATVLYNSSTFTNNVATNGGGLGTDGGSITLTSCVIHDNTAVGGSGAAVDIKGPWNAASTALISYCTITRNTGGWYAAIYARSAGSGSESMDLTIVDSYITCNYLTPGATSACGLTCDAATCTVVSSTIAYNYVLPATPWTALTYESAVNNVNEPNGGNIIGHVELADQAPHHCSCALDPCLNGGTCVGDFTGWYGCNCTTAVGYPDGDNCEFTACGDGVRAGAEECDDGNGVNNDTCSTNCTAITYTSSSTSSSTSATTATSTSGTSSPAANSTVTSSASVGNTSATATSSASVGNTSTAAASTSPSNASTSSTATATNTVVTTAASNGSSTTPTTSATPPTANTTTTASTTTTSVSDTSESESSSERVPAVTTTGDAAAIAARQQQQIIQYAAIGSSALIVLAVIALCLIWRTCRKNRVGPSAATAVALERKRQRRRRRRERKLVDGSADYSYGSELDGDYDVPFENDGDVAANPTYDDDVLF